MPLFPPQEFPEAPSETALVLAAQRGEQGAFAELARLYQGPVFRLAFYRTRSRADAEDITQDVLLQALRSLYRLKEAEKFKPWLFSIAANRIRDFRRRGRFRSLFDTLLGSAGGEPPLEEEAGDCGPQEALERREFWQQVGGALDRLPQMEREVLVLRFFEQMEIKEIASALGKGESTVKTHLYRALKKFQTDEAVRGLLVEEGL